MARLLYSATMSADGFIAGAWQGPQFVVTHDPPAESPPDVQFDGDLARAIAAARAAAGDEYVNVLGAEVARGCLELGELDEVLVLVAPILLGDGVRLFEHPGGTEVELERIGVEVEPVGTHLWFRVIR
jgi:dihydrofolate reductase